MLKHIKGIALEVNYNCHIFIRFPTKNIIVPSCWNGQSCTQKIKIMYRPTYDQTYYRNINNNIIKCTDTIIDNCTRYFNTVQNNCRR